MLNFKLNKMNDYRKKAGEILNQGGIVIFPTDTAFGIGCRIDNTQAVDRLFGLRRRPVTQATPVLVSSVEMALAYLDSPTDIVSTLLSVAVAKP